MKCQHAIIDFNDGAFSITKTDDDRILIYKVIHFDPFLPKSLVEIAKEVSAKLTDQDRQDLYARMKAGK